MRVWRNYKGALKFVEKLQLSSHTEWIQYCKGMLKGKPKKPDDIPSQPQNIYKGKGWIHWTVFLGPSFGKGYRPPRKRRVYRDYKSAAEFARSLKLKRSIDWERYCTGKLEGRRLPKKPDDIPYSVKEIYRDEWEGWGKWLGREG